MPQGPHLNTNPMFEHQRLNYTERLLHIPKAPLESSPALETEAWSYVVRLLEPTQKQTRAHRWGS